MATLNDLKQLAQHPQLGAQQKTRVEEAIRQLESIASHPDAQWDQNTKKGINPALWAQIFQILMSLLQTFLHPQPGPPAQQEAPQTQPQQQPASRQQGQPGQQGTGNRR